MELSGWLKAMNPGAWPEQIRSRRRARRFARAGSLYRDERNGEAEQLFRELLEEDYEPFQCWRHIARIAARRGEDEGALEAWRRAASLAPHDSESLIQASRFLIRARKYDAAGEALREALRRNPQSTKAERQFFRLLAIRGQRQ